MRRNVYLLSVVLLLGFVGASAADSVDSNLVGWWKFDETTGPIASDSSDYGNMGLLYNGPLWVAGYRDGALQFDGIDDYVNLYIGPLIPTLSECTFSIWVNWSGRPDPAMGGWQRIFDFGTSQANYIYICPSTGAANAAMRVAIVANNARWDEFDSSIGPLPTGWHHVAVTVSESTKTMILYVDGDVVGSKTNCVNSVNDLRTTTNNWLGRSQYYNTPPTPDPYFDGSLDDFKIYNRVLSQAEIKKVANPEKASTPIPADGDVINQPEVTLQWDAGLYAANVDGHHVYFGDNWEDVNEGARGTDRGLTSSTTYPLTGLEPGLIYYWRIDEVNGDNVWRGDIWSFTVQPLTAYNPSPSDGDKYLNPDVDLAWSPGAKAKSHDVYLGISFNDVNNSNRDNPLGVLIKQDHDANTYEPGTLQFDTTYFWRIDEVNGVDIWKGDVWTFETMPSFSIKPNLAGWWKMDEGEGTMVADWSGYYNHGTLINGPQWVTGQIGGALQFDGVDDYVELPIGSLVSTLSSSTLTIWVNFSNDGDAWQDIFNIGTGTDNYIYLSPRVGDNMDQPMYVEIAANGGAITGLSASSGILASGWHHVAVVIEPNNLQLYLDGQDVGSTLSSYSLSDLGVTTQNWLGRPRWPNDAYFMGSLDDFQIYDYGLMQAEILKTMRGDPLLAWNPYPSNGYTVDIEHALPLSWTPGEYAAQHDVYFGTDRSAVANADTDDTMGVYQVRQVETTYTPSEALQWGQTYYWRIDEVNAAPDYTVNKGNVWSFIVADYLIVDDFEDYNDYEPDRVFDTWVDGWGVATNGSQVGYSTAPFAELNIVNSGFQSMPFFYDNTAGVAYSEATRTFDAPQDWTRRDVEILTLFFKGYPRAFVEDPAGTYTMSAAGADVWDGSDEFRYAYKMLSGDGSITACVESIEDTDPWAKAGVMIRETLDPYSMNGFMLVTPENRRDFQNRPETGSGSFQAYSDTGVVTLPLWVRVVRQGNNITGYYSEDGTNWIQQPDDEYTGDDASPNPQTIVMRQDIYVGLAVCSHNANAVCTAVFSDVTTTGIVTDGDWQVEAIGVEMPVNDAQPLYVAVEGGGTVKVVEHPDNPNAVLEDNWQQWDISLSVLSDAGVDLALVDKMTIGVGSQTDPQDGKGSLFFDDIRLYLPSPSEP